MANIILVILGMIVVLCLIVIAVLFATRNTKTRLFVDKNGQVIKGSIAEQIYLNLGCVDQWILLRGKSIQNPILIFLHGGPGISLHGLFRYFHRDLESHFIVVGWDQRCAGKSYNKSIPQESIKIDTFVTDLHELIKYLKKRFNKGKVYILGESWGSLLGIIYSQKYPDDVEAYIGTGQISNLQESEQIGYEFMLEKAKKLNNKRALKQLGNIKQPPYSVFKDISILRKWLMKFGGCLYKRTSYLPWVFKMLLVDEYSWKDLLKISSGHNMTFALLHKELFYINLFTQIPELKVPVYFLLGKHDYQVSSKLAEQYFKFLKSQKKELIWFEKSGHNPMLEEPILFKDALLSIRYNIAFKPLGKKDLPMFFSWVKKPHIAKWWKSDTYEKFVEKYRPKISAQNYVYPFIIYINEKPIGYIQYYLADKADDGWWCKQQGQPVGTVGMDIIIGEEEYIGKGFGPIFIKKFIEKIFKETKVSKIIIDPDVKNEAAIRCYEKVGFVRVREIDSPIELFDTEKCKLLLMELKA